MTRSGLYLFTVEGICQSYHNFHPPMPGSVRFVSTRCPPAAEGLPEIPRNQSAPKALSAKKSHSTPCSPERIFIQEILKRLFSLSGPSCCKGLQSSKISMTQR